jgi:hypothetical protein
LWWNWEVDRDSYPDWEVLVAELAAQVLSCAHHTSPSSLSPHLLSHSPLAFLASQGIRVMGYVNPHLTDVSLKPAHHRNLFLEAREVRFCRLPVSPAGF